MKIVIWLSLFILSFRVIGASETSVDWPCAQPYTNDLSIELFINKKYISENKSTFDKQPSSEMLSSLLNFNLSDEAVVQLIEGYSKQLTINKNSDLSLLFNQTYKKAISLRVSYIQKINVLVAAQKNLADKIKLEVNELNSLAKNSPQYAEIESKIQIDKKIFNDKNKMIPYFCEYPVLVEKRLLIIGKEIQTNMVKE